MEAFDPQKHMQELKLEFKRTDDFYNKFRHDFTITLFLALRKFDKSFKLDEAVSKDLRLYADEMISCVESVLYKDLTYPEYRLEDEVKAMKRVVGKEPSGKWDIKMLENIHLSSKEMIVKYFEDIFDLSANGFRLLELYSRMYNWDFMSNLYAQKNEEATI